MIFYIHLKHYTISQNNLQISSLDHSLDYQLTIKSFDYEINDHLLMILWTMTMIHSHTQVFKKQKYIKIAVMCSKIVFPTSLYKRLSVLFSNFIVKLIATCVCLSTSCDSNYHMYIENIFTCISQFWYNTMQCWLFSYILSKYTRNIFLDDNNFNKT